MRLLIFITTLLIISSCTTQRKCESKFPHKKLASDTTFVYRDTVLFLKDIPVKLSYNHSISIPFQSLLRDTIIKDSAITITRLKERVIFDCSIDSLTLTLDSLKIQLRLKEAQINTVQQAYFDQKAENKHLRIEKRTNNRNARALVIKEISKMIAITLGAILLLLLIFGTWRKQRN